MKKQMSPAMIIAAIVAVVVVLGGVYMKQYVYAAPTPHPNRGVSTNGTGPTGPVNP